MNSTIEARVASLGSSLGEYHVLAMWRFDKLVLLLSMSSMGMERVFPGYVWVSITLFQGFAGYYGVGAATARGDGKATMNGILQYMVVILTQLDVDLEGCSKMLNEERGVESRDKHHCLIRLCRYVPVA